MDNDSTRGLKTCEMESPYDYSMVSKEGPSNRPVINRELYGVAYRSNMDRVGLRESR